MRCHSCRDSSSVYCGWVMLTAVMKRCAFSVPLVTSTSQKSWWVSQAKQYSITEHCSTTDTQILRYCIHASISTNMHIWLKTGERISWFILRPAFMLHVFLRAPSTILSEEGEGSPFFLPHHYIYNSQCSFLMMSQVSLHALYKLMHSEFKKKKFSPSIVLVFLFTYQNL